MNFDEIMRDITSGLTGDATKDMKYLEEQMQLYKDSDMAKEILRACGRLCAKLIPEEEKEELSRFIENDLMSYDAVLDEIGYNIYKKDYDKALKLSEQLVAKVEDSGLFQDDEVSEYHNFNEFIEEALFGYYHKTNKTIRKASIPYSKIYLQHGSLLFELERYNEAKEVLAKARRWNPADTNIAFEYIETFKAMNELEEFYKLTKETFKYAFRPTDIARCYRNLGYYFIEKQLYEVAASCYILSLEYDKKNPSAQSELSYIHQVAPKDMKVLTIEELEKYAKIYDFSLGVDADVLGLTYAYARKFMEIDEKEGAKYCFEILYNLTEDDEFKEIIDKLDEELEN